MPIRCPLAAIGEVEHLCEGVVAANTVEILAAQLQAVHFCHMAVPSPARAPIR